MKAVSSLLLLFTFTQCLFVSPSFSASPNDTNALTLFRLQTDTHGNLLSNWTGADACSSASAWLGVKCSASGRVVSLSLPSLSLRGPITSLSLLDRLRLLDLHNNRLNGTVLPVTNCTKLRLLYLSSNDFSGEIPPEISSLKHLIRLDISDNNIRGEIPGALTNLTSLLTLRLQNNELSGEIPDLSTAFPNLKELNLSNNELYGRLPSNLLKKFSDQSFSGNKGLCGSSPLPECSFTDTIPTAPPSGETVQSNPSSIPQTPIGKDKSHRGLSTGAIVAIVVANCVALLVVISFIIAYFCGRDRGSTASSKEGSESGRRRRRSGSSYGSEKRVYANGAGGGDSDGTNATDKSKLVFYDKKNDQFELEDLLRASAEMLGKGSFGTVYKAVLDDGCTVAVKRLKDANPCARREFEQYMDVIGKMKHSNVVRLRAYYYAKEEKLLVYDYLPNGSLCSLLHG